MLNRMTIRRHGVSMSSTDFAGLNGADPGLRDRPGGWTWGTFNRLTCKLQSVDELDLFEGGCVFGVTLTYGRRDGLPGPRSVAADVASLNEFMRRQGVECCHWLIEWQRDGYPHLHLIIKHSRQYFGREVVDKWLARTADHGSMRAGQDVKRMWSYDGYAKYLAKHASRQNFHYQRRSLPKSWGGYSGRMWGFWGDWNFQAAAVIDMDTSEWHSARRLVRRELMSIHNRSRPARKQFENRCSYLSAMASWAKSKRYLRRMFKGLPARLRDNEDYARKMAVARGDKPFSHEGWCRSWSTTAPIRAWMTEYLAGECREAAGVKQIGVMQYKDVDDEFEQYRSVWRDPNEPTDYELDDLIGSLAN